MKIDALGFVELLGYVAAVEAADAMLKTADVRLLAVHEVNPGLITVQVEGNLAACRVAVNAGRAAAERVGTVIATHVIGRPDPDIEDMVLHHMGNGAGRKAAPSVGITSTKPLEQSKQVNASSTARSASATHSTPRKKSQNAAAKASVTTMPARPSRSDALPKDQVRKIKADKQGKAMTQAARQWADALLGEMGVLDAGHEPAADEATTPSQRLSKSKRTAVKK